MLQAPHFDYRIVLDLCFRFTFYYAFSLSLLLCHHFQTAYPQSISINGSPVKSILVFKTTGEEPELEYTAFLKQTAEETETENGGQ